MSSRRAVRLRYLARLNPSVPEFSSASPDDPVTFLPLEAVWPGERLDVSRSRPKAEVESGYTRFREGDILIPKITPTFEADRSVMATGLANGFGCGTTEVHVLRAGPRLDRHFANYLVSSRSFLRGGKASMIGVAGQKRVPESFVLDYVVRLPSLLTQQVTADFLDGETARTDQLISVLQRRSRVIAERNVALARRLIFGDSSRFFTHSSELPAGWKVAQLKRLATIRRGRFGHRPRNDPALYGGQYPFVQTGDIASARRVITSYSQSLNDQGLATSALFPAGTLAMAIAANIGDVALLGFDACFPDSVVAFVPRPNVQPSFLYHLLRAVKPELLGVATLNTQLNVNTERIGEVVVPLPPREEQDVIVKTIDRAVDLEERGIVAISRQIALLKERRQALITAAVTGELDVTKGAA